MDCRTFRKHHFAYLDDTLPGDVMASAQCHLLKCDACAAHDTMVRRSLMIVRNLPTVEPSADFAARLRARLAECRETPLRHDEDADDDGFLDLSSPRRDLRILRGPRVWLAMAAGVTVVGTVALRSATGSATDVELAPVLAVAPATAPAVPPLVSPELVRAMSSGNPMWSMTQLLDEAPAYFLATSSEFEFLDAAR